MKVNITKEALQHVFKYGLFLCTAIIIAQLFPSHNTFNYRFEVGRPWMHGAVTAEFDFPIYKDTAEVAREQAELLRTLVPYYRVDTTVATVQYGRFVEDFQRANGYAPVHGRRVLQLMRHIYRRGIMATDDYDRLVATKTDEVDCILPDRMTRRVALDSLFTPRTAWEHVTVEQSAVERNLLASYNLNAYLVENLVFDSLTTAVSRVEALAGLSLTQGMVMEGERIIDRGEIVSPEASRQLQSLGRAYSERIGLHRQSAVTFAGRMLLVLGFITLLYAYYRSFRHRLYARYGNLLLVLLLILVVSILTSLSVRFHSEVIHYYMVPYALLPIVIRVFFDSRTALFVHMITMVICSFMVDEPFRFLVIQMAVGMLVVNNLSDLSQRSQLTQTAFYVFLANLSIYIVFDLIMGGRLDGFPLRATAYFAVGSAFLLLTYIVIYLFERVFGLVSNVTLVELTDINSDLMIRFAESAPGTFQHSLQVSNLATEAAKKIGANSLLVRTGALYHDIGKMTAPGFFTENQVDGLNPLAERPFEEAARIIIDHVPHGVQIAKKHHLPEQIVHFITTHHGQSKVKYFYNSFLNANPGVQPDEAAFTYPGPLPDSKETAILMMADAVEARSRSLKKYTETSISAMVEDMIDAQVADGQLKDAPITFKDVEAVKAVFKEKLTNIYHTRIAYPKAPNKAVAKE